MEPKEVEVEGKYGKRKMWLLNTSIGLVYFTPVQFVEVTERMRMADFPESGVEYP
jgi:Na+/melibiose symporter-like transporter